MIQNNRSDLRFIAILRHVSDGNSAVTFFFFYLERLREKGSGLLNRSPNARSSWSWAGVVLSSTSLPWVAAT